MLGAEQVSTLAAPHALSRLPFMSHLTTQPFTRLPSPSGFELDSDACLASFHSDSEPSGSVGYAADDAVSYAASSSSSVAGDDNNSVTTGFFQESLPRSMLPQLVASPRKTPTAAASALSALRPTALEAAFQPSYPRTPREAQIRQQQASLAFPTSAAAIMSQQPPQPRACDPYGASYGTEPALSYSLEVPQYSYNEYSPQHQQQQQFTPTHLRADHSAMKRKLIGLDSPYQQQPQQQHQQQQQSAMYYHHTVDPATDAFAAPLKRARLQQEDEIKMMPQMSCNPAADMYGMNMQSTAAPLTPSHYLPSMTTSRVSFHATVGEVSPQGMLPVHVQQRIVHHTRTSVPTTLMTPTSMDHMGMLSADPAMNAIKAEPSPYAQHPQQQRAFDFELQQQQQQQQQQQLASPMSNNDWNNQRWYPSSAAPVSAPMQQPQPRMSMARPLSMDSAPSSMAMPGAVPHLAVAELPYCNRSVAAAIALPALELSHLSMPNAMSQAPQQQQAMLTSTPQQSVPSSTSPSDGSPVPPKKAAKAKRAARKAKALTAAGGAAPAAAKPAKVKVQPQSPPSAASAEEDDCEDSPKAGSPDSTPGLILVCSVETCRKEFSSRYSHRRHMRNHTGERPHVCPFDGCDAKFAERSTLVRHIRVHTGEKPYKCSFPGCNQAFADRTNVKRHLLTHTGTKPYPCMYADCSRRYSRKCYLTKHMISSHNYVPPAPAADAEEDDFDSQAFEEEERDQSPSSRRK